MLQLIEKIVGSKRKRDVQKLYPIVEEINEYFEQYESLSDEELKGKTAEFRARIAERTAEDEARLVELRERLSEDLDAEERDIVLGDITATEDAIYQTTQEVLDEILPEAFAVVKETCRRHIGKEWEAGGSIIRWDMVHYDVQLIGGIVLHQGKIAEMATGEGKTLVATLPVYLNALPGRGVHMVTVNDYLARRDSEWMGPIYEFLGLTVGCIQSAMLPNGRKKQYDCDITFGTNNEFGFDYLRDNMAGRPEDLVQRPHYYAIVDEVDSVLIDEARTPLIISGPVATESDQNFDLMKPRVEHLVKLQSNEVSAWVADAEKLIEKGDKESLKQAGVHLLRSHRGMPKHRRLMKLLQEASNKRLLDETELEFLRDKGIHMQEIDDELYFAIDEKQHSIDLTDKGRDAITRGGEDPELFLLPDLASELSDIEGGDLPTDDKVERRNEAMARFSDRSDRIHTVQQLLRAYTLYEKDVEYLVDDDKIKIIDTFTGRTLEGRRYSEGLHQAIEAKESVRVQEDTQTFATITIQNYFRLYRKLAGMTGTAETEEGEFHEIYKLDVVVIPTHRPVVRDDMNDLIFRTKRSKYNAVADEVERLQKFGRPVLVGTTSVEVSETISRMLRLRKIQHSVLNARQHHREADIVAMAGQKGAVTIATNMAGRGTDIKLGPGVRDNGGLHILGTERHESRRIDRQLRGRAGRQGDPGSSQFYISLEDDLMRLFGGEKMTSWMEKLGASDEVLESGMLNKAVTNAQKKVEENNFSIRKRLLEYDDVMNNQRTVIYDRRAHALHGERLRGEVFEFIEELVDEQLELYFPEEIDHVRVEMRNRLLIDPEISTETAEEMGRDEIHDRIMNAAREFYGKKEEQLGSEFMGNLERWAVLRVIDMKWRDHLREMDELKNGIHLRAYGQLDPLVEYKKEAYTLFQALIAEINNEVVSLSFRTFPQMQPPRADARVRQDRPARQTLPAQGGAQPSGLRYSHATAAGIAGAASEAVAAGGQAAQGQTNRGEEKQQPMVRQRPKIGRNDPCYCGSGKKFKHCHGR